MGCILEGSRKSCPCHCGTKQQVHLCICISRPPVPPNTISSGAHLVDKWINSFILGIMKEGDLHSLPETYISIIPKETQLLNPTCLSHTPQGTPTCPPCRLAQRGWTRDTFDSSPSSLSLRLPWPLLRGGIQRVPLRPVPERSHLQGPG